MTPTSPPRPTLSREELRRYSRQLLVPEWQEAGAQERLRVATVLVVGAGGLGGPVILQLAGAGVGRLVISDGDAVDLSNLHRQTLYSLADVGRRKAEVAAARAQALNPRVEVEVAPALDAGNADMLVSGADLVVDATDNFAARYGIADACRHLGREWVWGAASGTAGMVSVFGPALGLRDVFPDPGEAESCDEAGVLGPLPNIVGSMMALEVLKVLGGVGDTLRGRLWTLDALDGRVRVLHLRGAVPSGRG
ncbi:HesA/MoeB/ThiF family protein [Deinococcus apachensis]|uniref:HesA/MoeB/ThiF family protein n=1 Tax=Deinococcus apachensis TaxID=309886 RepID=UPI00036D452C|nr:HesA/MoeB/ThiF family protein [Deinococcus apachensis]